MIETSVVISFKTSHFIKPGFCADMFIVIKKIFMGVSFVLAVIALFIIIITYVIIKIRKKDVEKNKQEGSMHNQNSSYSNL